MWLDNLKELRKKTGMTVKQIAEQTNLPERTVSRIFSGDTDAPRVDTLRRMVAVLGGSLDDLFAESGSVVANADLISLQDENERLRSEIARLKAENELLGMKLEHKEELLAVHNYYLKRKSKN